MKVTEIKFKDWMVNFVPQGEKTVTRRCVSKKMIINEWPARYVFHGLNEDFQALFEDKIPEVTPWIAPIDSPFGTPGDLLQIAGREIYMIIEEISLERLHDITPEDAIKEGCSGLQNYPA